jgi:hypothetical protein
VQRQRARRSVVMTGFMFARSGPPCQGHSDSICCIDVLACAR